TSRGDNGSPHESAAPGGIWRNKSILRRGGAAPTEMTPTMSQLAFLAAIRENAEDDATRLVYADWLDEHGQPGNAERAELIRVQCALARLPPDDPGAASLLRREEELLAQCGPALRAALEAHPGVQIDGNARGELGAERAFSVHDVIPGVRVAGCLERGF